MWEREKYCSEKCSFEYTHTRTTHTSSVSDPNKKTLLTTEPNTETKEHFKKCNLHYSNWCNTFFTSKYRYLFIYMYIFVNTNSQDSQNMYQLVTSFIAHILQWYFILFCLPHMTIEHLHFCMRLFCFSISRIQVCMVVAGGSSKTFRIIMSKWKWNFTCYLVFYLFWVGYHEIWFWDSGTRICGKVRNHPVTYFPC